MRNSNGFYILIGLGLVMLLFVLLIVADVIKIK